MHTKASNSLLDTDITPASFWITLPTNYFYNNSAAGSDWYGFWFDLSKPPSELSASDDVCPRGDLPPLPPLGAFEDNTAHSNVRDGVRLFDGSVPVLGDACLYSTEAAMKKPDTSTLLRYTGYRNGRTGAISTAAAADLGFANVLVMSP